jgi:hypothetical protein
MVTLAALAGAALLLAGCSSGSTVTVNFSVLDGSGVTDADIDAYLADASRIYASAGITFVRGDVTHVSPADTARILSADPSANTPTASADGIINDYSFDPNDGYDYTPAANPEIAQLFATGVDRPNEVTAYFVPGMMTVPNGGRAYLDLGYNKLIVGTGAANYAALTESGQPLPPPGGAGNSRNFAHELGHMLGLPHVTDADNLMNQGGAWSALGLTQDQLDTVGGSSYVR